MTTLRVQSVLFHSDADSVVRAFDALAHAGLRALKSGDFTAIEMAYGDCSSMPIFDAARLNGLVERHPHVKVQYQFFEDNLGSAKGHNTLLATASTDMVLIMNPDVMLAPDTLIELALPFQSDRVGMVEARQLPVEHPKEYNVLTGETSWAATACALMPTSVCREVEGFDHETFFLYCDDVDFSWRIRLAGYKVIYQPSAVVFHDKRLGSGGRWVAGSAEQYFSAEAALLLSWKWSRPDITDRLLTIFRGAAEAHLQKAAATFEQRRAEGRLPCPLDTEHRVAQFVDDAYAAHRFVIA
ncbi:glycosyltransferase [Pseudorhodoferax sp. Leaf267]|uniref:glycosyltransferase n=1 Tax=Pseudorhodoferax sp. Leaf267 TaxID=1736316 RepID=UPI0007000AD4|nr:glycosyltransferase family 2 protein [Pseudorhodoferax sp. Leaf267]KQP13575.1 hypothetical protein ASF43_16810 [Pseudorhodoferax sp. Leaf267]